MYYYVVDEDLGVSIWKNGVTQPMYVAPRYPNGETFIDAEDAAKWGQSFIHWLTNEYAPFPYNGRGIPGESKESWRKRSGLRD